MDGYWYDKIRGNIYNSNGNFICNIKDGSPLDGTWPPPSDQPPADDPAPSADPTPPPDAAVPTIPPPMPILGPPPINPDF